MFVFCAHCPFCYCRKGEGLSLDSLGRLDLQRTTSKSKNHCWCNSVWGKAKESRGFGGVGICGLIWFVLVWKMVELNLLGEIQQKRLTRITIGGKVSTSLSLLLGQKQNRQTIYNRGLEIEI